MENTSQSKIAIYSRKSKFTGKGESIENQIELCKNYIQTMYGDSALADIVIYEDEGFSGGNLERPKFKEMMATARAKNLRAVVCYRLDRISRNIGDFASLIEEFGNLGVSFISIKEQFDTSSPMGRAMMYIASVFSQLERETIAERIRDNMHELAKTGRWLGGQTPTGYASESVESVTIDGKTKKAYKLTLLPNEASVVSLIFDKFFETRSLTKTETFLINDGFKSKKGNYFSRFTLKLILQNPVYMIADEEAYNHLTENEASLFSDKADFDSVHGVMAYNRTVQKPGKAMKFLPMQDWIVSVGKHKGLVPGKRWIETQNILEGNRSSSYRNPRSNVALLSSLLFCAHCGDYMRPKLTTRKNPNGGYTYSYRCVMKDRSLRQACNNKNINGNLLDQAIIDEIKKIAEEGSDFFRQYKEAKRTFSTNQEDYEKNVQRLKKSYDENEKAIGTLIITLSKASGSTAEQYVIQQIDSLHKANEQLKVQIEEIESLVKIHTLSSDSFGMIKNLLTSFKNTIDQMSIEEKRAAIRSVIRKIKWDSETIHIYFFGSEGEVDLKTLAGGADSPSNKLPMDCGLNED